MNDISTYDFPLKNDFFLLSIKYKKDDYHVDFCVWKVSWIDGDVLKPYFFDSKASCSSDGSEDKSKSAPYIEGSLKWDGCINYRYPGQDVCMLHNCGINDFKNELKVFQLLYEKSSEIISHADFLKEE